MATSDDLASKVNALLETIASSLSATEDALPTTFPSTPNGLSLLDLKNVLLLSYIENLVLLILSKLESPTFTFQNPDSQKIIWNLIQDRIYLEKEVFTLENKIS